MHALVLAAALFPAIAALFAGPTDPKATPVAGSWTGVVNTGGVAYQMGVSLDAEGGGTYHYSAPYDCDGNWNLRDHSGNSYTYLETVVYQYRLGTNCPSGEMVVVTLDPATHALGVRRAKAGASEVTQGTLVDAFPPTN